MGCVPTSGYKAADFTNIVAGNIKSGVSAAGVVGDYPSSTYKLSGAGGASGLTNATFTARIKSSNSFEYWDEVGTRHTNAGDSDIIVSNIKENVSIFGSLGTYDGRTNAPSGFSTEVVGNTAIDLSWISNSSTGYLLIRRPSSAVSWIPTDSISYSLGSQGSNNEIIYIGASTSFQDSGLTGNTDYHYALYSYDASNIFSLNTETQNTTFESNVCSSGSTQVFSNNMIGCSGNVIFSSKDSLCSSGWSACSSQQWLYQKGGLVPNHHYWTSDDLNYLGSGSGSCAVSTSAGSSCGADPMRVCTNSANDSSGNSCNWLNCGMDTNSPNQFFGGCSGNTTAGSLCCKL